MYEFDTSWTFNEDLIKQENLVHALDERDVGRIAQMVIEGHDADKASRSMWENRTDAAMKLALQVQEQKSFPWPGAASVVFPLVTIAAMQFHSQAYPALIQGYDVVRYRAVDGAEKTEIARARRIGRHMSWQVLEEDESWEEQHKRLFINLAIVGTAFTKSYYDGQKRYPVTELVTAQDFIVDYGAKSVEDAERGTHCLYLARNKIWERCASGAYTDVREEGWFKANAQLIQGSTQESEKDRRQGTVQGIADRTTRYRVYEQHVSFDLDHDGYAEPYIATVAVDSRSLLRLVARVDAPRQVIAKSGKLLRIQPTHYFTKYGFIPSADNGFYDDGFGKLIGPLNETVSSAINQMLDSGTLQNSFGGFLGRGVKIRGGVYNAVPWEWKRVDSTGDDLRKNVVPFPEKSPPTVMFQLLSLIIDYVNRIAGTTDPMVGENPGQNTPASTFQGMQEQGLRIYKMIFKGVWGSMRCEFRKLYDINAYSLPLQMNFGRNNEFIRQEDYSSDSGLLAPVADPNATSTIVKMQQAMAMKQSSMTTPGYDREVVEKLWLKALGIENIDEVFPGEGKVKPLPNPKMQVEQGRMQVKQMELAYKKWEFLQQMQIDRRKIMAEIEHLNTQSAQILAQIGAEKGALALEAFDKIMTHLQAHAAGMTERIQALMGQKDDEQGGEKDEQQQQQSQAADAGGVPGLAGPPGDGGGQADVPQGGGEPQAAMGGSDLLSDFGGGEPSGE